MPEPEQHADGGIIKRLPTRWRHAAVPVFRALIVVLLVNAACGLAARLGAGAAPSDLFGELVNGKILELLRPHGPGAAVRGLHQALPATTVALLAAVGAMIGGVLAMRPSAVIGLAFAGLLLLLTLRATGAHLWRDLEMAHPLPLLMALFCYGTVIMLTVVRWRMLLEVQDVHLPFLTLCRLTLIGVFFNLAIPGAVGGDLVKMGAVARHTSSRRTEAMLTIFLDRVVGVLGLFIVAAAAVASSLSMLLALDDRYRPLQAGALVVALGSVGGIAGVLAVEFRGALVRLRWIVPLIVLGDRVLPSAVTCTIRRLIDAIDLYRNSRATVLKAVLLAVAVHLLLSLSLFLVGRSLGESEMGLREYVVTASVANTVAAIPVTPGGLGTRDATAAAFFTAFEAKPLDRVGSIPIVLSLIILVWALVGAAVFVLSPAKGKALPAPDIRAPRAG